jgi:Complex 1 protein (LYR family)
MSSNSSKSHIFTKAQLLALYKELLSHARRFPSVRRNGMIEDIRIEFKLNAKLTDPKKITQAIELALHGLKTMQKYTKLSPKSTIWKVDLEEDPFPKKSTGNEEGEPFTSDVVSSKPQKLE